MVGLSSFQHAALRPDAPPGGLVPIEPPEQAAEVAKPQCPVRVRASSLPCATTASAQAAGVRGAMILGWQGLYVRLTSSGVSYDAQTGILRRGDRAEPAGPADRHPCRTLKATRKRGLSFVRPPHGRRRLVRCT